MANEALPYRPCVGVCLINRDGAIFGGKRIDMKTDAWQMPQGGVDNDETPDDAALRELFEETGVKADLITLEASTPYWLRYDLPQELIGRFWGGRFRGQRQKWYAYRFKGNDADINIATDHPEFSKWAWKSKKELIEAIVPFKKEIYEQVLGEFSPFLA